MNIYMRNPKHPICKSIFEKNVDGKNVYLPRVFIFKKNLKYFYYLSFVHH